MAYRVIVLPDARSALRGLGAEVSRPVGFALRALEDDPRPDHCKKIRPASDGKPALYRIHVDIDGGAAWRVFYSVVDGQLTVIAAGVRRKGADTYKQKNLILLQRKVQEFLQDQDEGE